MKLWQKIDSYITDLPEHQKLAKKIANYVMRNKNTYNKAQIQQICDEFYNNDICGWGIADDLWAFGVL